MSELFAVGYMDIERGFEITRNISKQKNIRHVRYTFSYFLNKFFL